MKTSRGGQLRRQWLSRAGRTAIRCSREEALAIVEGSGLDANHPWVRHVIQKVQRGRVEDVANLLGRLRQIAEERIAKGAAPFPILGTSGRGITLGETTDGVVHGKNLHRPLESFPRHIGVFGMTGTGKTYCMMHIARQLIEQGITVWIFDRSRDFRRMIPKSGNHPLTYLKPEWLCLCLTQPPGRISAWKNKLVELLTSVYYGREGSGMALGSSLEELYASQHCSSDGSQWPTLAEWIRALARMQPNGRSRIGGYYESGQRILQAVQDGFPGVFERKESVPLERLANTSFVLDVSDLSVLQYLFMLLFLLEQTSLESDVQGLRRVVFIDEASEIFNEQHVRRQSHEHPPQHDIPRRYRGRGIGLVLADQTPSLLPRDVQSNLSTVIALRLVNSACVRTVATASGMSAGQAAVLPTLPSQHAIAHCAELGTPYLVRLPFLDLPEAPSVAALESRQAELVPHWMTTVSAAREQSVPAREHSGVGLAPSEEQSGRGPEVTVPDAENDRIAAIGEARKRMEFDEAGYELTAGQRSMLERIGKFPQETIGERQSGLRLERMEEYRLRQQLQARGLIALAGRIGKVEFFSPTDAGKGLLQERGVHLASFKSGWLHEIVLRRIEELAGGQGWQLSRGGQLGGVQPDGWLRTPTGGCVLVQVSVTNSVRYEAERARTLRQIAGVRGVLLVGVTQAKVDGLKKVLEVRGVAGEQMLPLEGSRAIVAVVHAKDILAGGVDFGGIWRPGGVPGGQECQPGEAEGSGGVGTDRGESRPRDSGAGLDPVREESLEDQAVEAAKGAVDPEDSGSGGPGCRTKGGQVSDGQPEAADTPRLRRGDSIPRYARVLREVSERGEEREEGKGCRAVSERKQKGLRVKGVKEGRRMNVNLSQNAGMLTFSEAAAFCSVSTKSISRAVKSGDLEVVQAPGTLGLRGRRIPREILEQWLSVQETRKDAARKQVTRSRGPSSGRQDRGECSDPT